MGDYFAVNPNFYPVIPAKAGIQRAGDAVRAPLPPRFRTSTAASANVNTPWQIRRLSAWFADAPIGAHFVRVVKVRRVQHPRVRLATLARHHYRILPSVRLRRPPTFAGFAILEISCPGSQAAPSAAAQWRKRRGRSSPKTATSRSPHPAHEYRPPRSASAIWTRSPSAFSPCS